MGWGTNLFCNIYFNKKTYRYKEQVEDDIEELDKGIKTAKDELFSLVFITDFPKFFKESEEDLYYVIQQKIKDNFDIIEDYIHQKTELLYLLNNWEACHTVSDNPISPPEGIEYDTAFISGDFIE